MRTDNANIAELMGGPFSAMNPSVGEFHASGGLTFTRTERHGIMVRLWEKRENGWHFRVLTFMTDEQWQSIAAAIRAPETEEKA